MPLSERNAYEVFAELAARVDRLEARMSGIDELFAELLGLVRDLQQILRDSSGEGRPG